MRTTRSSIGVLNYVEDEIQMIGCNAPRSTKSGHVSDKESLPAGAGIENLASQRVFSRVVQVKTPIARWAAY